MIEKYEPIRSKVLRESVRDQACVNCDIQDGTVVLAHLPPNGIKGIALKADDIFGAGLCWRCHDRADSDPEYITDHNWRSRMVLKQQRIWIKNGLIKLP